MTHTWYKQLTRSDAQQKTQGSLMRFIRLTKSNLNQNFKVWFRDNMFREQNWQVVIARGGRQVEEAQVLVSVNILGEDKGVRTMILSHDINRSLNHSAPTTHLVYDTQTADDLRGQDLVGHYAVLIASPEGIEFRIQAAIEL